MWPNAGLLLVQRRRPTLGRRLMFAGMGVQMKREEVEYISVAN